MKGRKIIQQMVSTSSVSFGGADGSTPTATPTEIPPVLIFLVACGQILSEKAALSLLTKRLENGGYAVLHWGCRYGAEDD